MATTNVPPHQQMSGLGSCQAPTSTGPEAMRCLKYAGHSGPHETMLPGGTSLIFDDTRGERPARSANGLSWTCGDCGHSGSVVHDSGGNVAVRQCSHTRLSWFAGRNAWQAIVPMVVK